MSTPDILLNFLSSEFMKIVIDTNVLVAALKSRKGASFQIVSMLPERLYHPMLSVPLMLEYEDVLKRQIHNLNANDIDAILSKNPLFMATIFAKCQR